VTTTVFLVRHGAHDRLNRVLCGRMAGVALNAEGHRQAERVAARLAREPISALYVSPLLRAEETAAPIAKALQLTPVIADDLNEVDFGDWTGAAFDDLNTSPAWALWNQARSHHRAPGGETMLEAQLRAVRWLEQAAARHPEQSIAAVCHSDVIKALLCHGLSLSVDQHHRLEVSPGAVSIVISGPWGTKIHSVNEAPL